MNLSTLLDMAADGFGDRVVIGRRADGYTAEQLRRLSVGGAALIRDADAGCLVYLDVNGPCFPVAMFASARAGVPIVPMNYRLGEEALRKLAANHRKAIAVADPRFHQMFDAIGVSVHTAADWLAHSAERAGDDLPPNDTNEPAVIVYTSGTTSEPKGVLLGHDHLISYVLATVEFMSADEHDASLISVPPYHIAAVANAVTNLYAGRRCLVLEQFTGRDWLDLVRTEQITNALVVPTMLARILQTEGDRSVPSLRSLAYGGAAMPARVIEEAVETWKHVDFVNAYGLTETSSTVAVLGPDEHRAALSSTDPAVRARLRSAGRPVPGVEIEIRDIDGSTVAAGAPGQIWVRGQQVSGQYAGKGSVLDAQGWFHTRDEGYLDDNGYLFIGGRTDDTIIRGGENIAPAEIEDTLLAHDDIGDAVVVGVPDIEWGQHLEAVVVPKPGRTVDPVAVRGYVREHLRSSKTPDRVLVWDELPRTDLGKVVRRHVVDLILADAPATAG